MTEPRMIDWDDAYSNMAHVPGSESLPDHWAAEAAAYRASGVPMEGDLPYGDGPRQRLDIVWPDGGQKGLAIFVHGGYWMRLAKSDWTHLAEGARSCGWAVALLGYTLTPQARISEIVAEIGRGVTWAAGRVPGPIRLAGHSAGGHLVSRMVCTETPLPPPVAARIEKVVSISGVHDLRPLLRTQMNATLGLDLAEARAQSPALLEPRIGSRVTAWVGGGERPEFLRQAQLLSMAWAGFDCQTDLVIDGLHNHFTVIEGLKSPDASLTRAWL